MDLLRKEVPLRCLISSSGVCRSSRAFVSASMRAPLTFAFFLTSNPLTLLSAKDPASGLGFGLSSRFFGPAGPGICSEAF